MKLIKEISLFTIILLCCARVKAAGDTVVLNKYVHITAILNYDPTTPDSFVISKNDHGILNIGDTIVIHQAKGTSWRYGYSNGQYLSAQYSGRFEFHIISNIIASGLGDTIILPSALNFDPLVKYKAEHVMQAVKVASFMKFAPSSSVTLSADPWDSKQEKGGILAIMVDTLVMNSNIDLTGKGFKGGNPLNIYSNGLKCSLSDTVYNRGNFSYGAVDSAGLKGESVVIFDSMCMRGKENLYSGGGGGNGYQSGGGGGSSYGNGGAGGIEANKCASNLSSRGYGGNALQGGLLSQSGVRAVFGGGGGSSAQKSPFHASRGGNGGGIVLLIANVIQGNVNIISNGESVVDPVPVDAGAGGGGGGGAIFLDINQISGNLIVNVNGGNGGSTKLLSDTAGPGGGGGGGYIYYSGLTIPATLNYAGGTRGSASIPRSNSSGGPGHAYSNLVMPVKDVLFNIMPPNQKICAGKIPKRFNASKPKGGNGYYSFKWYKSTNAINWDSIPNAWDSTMYQYQALFTTTYFKRVVKSIVAYDTIIDSLSTYLTVNVLPAITNNLVSILGQDTLCSGIQFPKLKGTKVVVGGNGVFNYQWQDSIGSLSWKDTTGSSNDTLLQPVQNATAKFRRIVTSSVCVDTSSVEKITVLPLIKNNLIGNTQWVSMGDTAHYLRSIQSLTGGNGTYQYLWQQNTDTLLSWSNAASLNSKVYYKVSLINDTMYYRREVFSGEGNTCISNSNILTINILDSLVNNLITGTQIICGRTIPYNFVGTKPHGGDKTNYNYKWENSSDGSNWDSIAIISDSNDTIFNPGIIDPGESVHSTTFLYFRRIVRSGPNYCCKDTSNTIKITIRPYIKNNLILYPDAVNDTIICYNQRPDTIIAGLPSDGNGPYNYTWQASNNIINWNIAQGDTVKQGYKFPNDLLQTTYLRRKIISGICTSYSDTLKITVLPLIGSNTISSNHFVCRDSTPDPLIGHKPNGGDGSYRYKWQISLNNSTWADATGKNDTINYQPDTTSVTLYFKRIVKSGLQDCCIDTSVVFTINIHELPTLNMANFDDSLCAGLYDTLHLTLTGKDGFNVKYTNGIDLFQSPIIDTLDYDLIFQANVPGNFSYKILSVTDGNGCNAKQISGSGKLSVFEVPKANITGTKDSVCGIETVLNANPSVGKGIWKWKSNSNVNFNDSSATPKPAVTVPDTGKYTFTWLENNNGCTSSAAIIINFFMQPIKVSAGNDQEGRFMFRTTMNATAPKFGVASWSSPDNTIYIQDHTNPNTFVDSLKLGKNYFIWTISNGSCPSVSDTMTVTTDDIIVPKGFSPNSDAVNDTFYIKGLEYTKNAELIILNKWGKIVYQSNDYKNDWTGNYNGSALPEDNYFFILKVIGRTYKGYLVIRR